MLGVVLCLARYFPWLDRNEIETRGTNIPRRCLFLAEGSHYSVVTEYGDV